MTRIGFESGQRVREGHVLVELEARTEKAQLAAAEAQRELARTTHERANQLVEKGAVARVELDDAEAALAAANSQVEAARAAVDHKQVRAPFTGRVGIRAVNVGQYVTPGTRVTTLDSVGAVFVDFALPQDNLGVVRAGMPVRVATRAGEPFEGTISAVDPTLDAATRSVRLRASVEQHGDKLRAGMFVTVNVVLPQRIGGVIVPATAVVYAPYGNSVFSIEAKPAGSPGMTTTPDGKAVKIAQQRFVRLGRMRGDFVAISHGLPAGTQVVSEGAFKLRNGSPIVIDNRVKARPELDPRPENR